MVAPCDVCWKHISLNEYEHNTEYDQQELTSIFRDTHATAWAWDGFVFHRVFVSFDAIARGGVSSPHVTTCWRVRFVATLEAK